jgi:2-methylisocitrate lyase-like PEP mutase family enzyme
MWKNARQYAGGGWWCISKKRGRKMKQEDKAQAFQSLHEQESAFIIPNPWDAGSARLLAMLGFKALATTSAGFAFSQGLPDFGVGRDHMLAHAAQIVQATELPVSADLENGFADAPEAVAETIRLAAQAGLAGGSIEDASGHADNPIYEFELAVDRIRAACEAVRALPVPFVLTARAENHLHGRTDLNDTIKRLHAYQEAGANVLYAPGLRAKADIASVVAALDKPVNVLMGLPGVHLSLAELSDIGVKRVSVGSSLSRAALGSLLRASREMLENGTFTFADDAPPYSEINDFFRGEA